jgi:rhomboid-like protein
MLWHFSTNPTFVENNFLVSWDALQEGRYWVLLTSVFSHNMFLHLLINMYVLMSFGSLLEQVLGPKRFLRFYLTAGIISSLTHALASAFILHEPGLPALGASGAIAGLVLLFALMFPRQKLYLFGLIPLPALGGALAFMCLDLFGLFEQARGSGIPIGHGAHLGGALAGVIYYLFWIKPKWLSTAAIHVRT